MRLEHMTWLAVESYLTEANGILIATGSTEQHGPVGLIGTDAICSNSIATEVANATGAIVAPPLTYTPAPFNTSFPGTLSISSTLFQQLASELFEGLRNQGFRRIYVINGHGANLEPLTNVSSSLCDVSINVRSWWSFESVQTLVKKFYGEWEGMHATPSEVAITQYLTGIIHQGADTPPTQLSADYIRAHAGDKHGPPQEHRQSFPDGRVGSHSGLATPEHGKQLFDTAVAAITADYNAFRES